MFLYVAIRLSKIVRVVSPLRFASLRLFASARLRVALFAGDDDMIPAS